MNKHRHRAIRTKARTVGWTYCVANQSNGACSGAPHGSVTYVDTCKCGARRFIESNGNHQASSGWIEAEFETE